MASRARIPRRVLSTPQLCKIAAYEVIDDGCCVGVWVHEGETQRVCLWHCASAFLRDMGIVLSGLRWLENHARDQAATAASQKETPGANTRFRKSQADGMP